MYSSASSDMMVDHNKDAKVHLSLDTAKLIEMQNDDTFFKILVKLMNEKNLSQPQRYFVSNKELLHKVMKEDNKSFHALLVPWALIKYILHQMHDTLGHIGTFRTYWYVKHLYYCKGFTKDVDNHVIQCLKFV